MAAAFRHVARTLQRTPVAAAAAEHCPGLSQRLGGGPSPAVSSSRRFTASSFSGAPTSASSIHVNDGKRLFDTRILDEKKKELYNLLSEIHGSKNCILRRPDRRLLRELSMAVEGDPKDTVLLRRQWAYLTRMLIKPVLIFYLGYKTLQWKASDDRLEEVHHS